MVAPEVLSLLRVAKPYAEVAANYGAFCRARRIRTHAVRICNGPRGLRGLCAKQDVAKGTVLVSVPFSSLITIASVWHDRAFMHMLPADVRRTATSLTELVKSVGSSSLLSTHQLILATYMAFNILFTTPERHVEGIVSYMDFLPRHEGYFVKLNELLSNTLDASLLCHQLQELLSRKLGLSGAEVRQLLLWCLNMIFSRQLPMRDRGIIQSILVDHCNEIPNAFTLPVLCPIVDLCNHSALDNVDLDVDMEGKNLQVVANNNIAVGTELTIGYSANINELQLYWGIAKLL